MMYVLDDDDDDEQERSPKAGRNARDGIYGTEETDEGGKVAA